MGDRVAGRSSLSTLRSAERLSGALGPLGEPGNFVTALNHIQNAARGLRATTRSTRSGERQQLRDRRQLDPPAFSPKASRAEPGAVRSRLAHELRRRPHAERVATRGGVPALEPGIPASLRGGERRVSDVERVPRRRWSRREFLVAAGASAAAALVPRAAGAAGTDRVLVALFLQGAADGLNLCVRKRSRSTTGSAPPCGSRRERRSTSMASSVCILRWRPLLPLYRRGSLALVHAVGSPDPTRSHFDGRTSWNAARPATNRSPTAG